MTWTNVEPAGHDKHNNGSGVAYYRVAPLVEYFDEWRELSSDFFAGINDEDGWMSIAFFEEDWSDDENSYVNLLFTSEGPSGSLRELRHTNFQNGGYVFMMSLSDMQLALGVLGEFFDD